MSIDYTGYRDLKDCFRHVVNCVRQIWDIREDASNWNYVNKEISTLQQSRQDTLTYVKDTYGIENQKQLEKTVESLQRQFKLEFPEHTILNKQPEQSTPLRNTLDAIQHEPETQSAYHSLDKSDIRNLFDRYKTSDNAERPPEKQVSPDNESAYKKLYQQPHHEPTSPSRGQARDLNFEQDPKNR
jgi:hypothetical protein